MLEARVIRELLVDDSAGSLGQAHLSAASGLVKSGNRLFVVTDDEHHLAMFDLSNGEPGRLIPIFDGGLPLRHKAEDTADTYSDGHCAGSVIGLVDAGGTIRTLQRLAEPFKVEGIAASGAGDMIDLLLVTDADDRRQPALLLSTKLHRMSRAAAVVA